MLASWDSMPENDNGPEEKENENEKLVKLNQLYLLILTKYKKYIEEKENISVAELPTLITPKDPLVAKKAAELKEGISNYIYDINFNEAALKAFNFVTNEIADASLPLQFWLAPAETLKFGMGDITDKSILLCSLFIALGNPSSKVIVVLNSTKTISVYYEFSNSFTLLNIRDKGITVYQTKEELLGKLGISEDSSAYEFNDQLYQDIA